MTRDVLPETNRPGGSAEIKFEAMAKDWRRSRLVGVRRVCVGLVAVLALVGAHQHHAVAFNLGFFAGCVMTFFMCARQWALPSYIDNWRTGAEGEKRTGKVLARLGPEWTVRHDLQGRYGNTDHFVSGPGGVYLIDTKTWTNGVTTITSDGPSVQADHDPELQWEWKGVPGRMRGAAAGASDALLTLGGRRIYVTALVVIWGDFPGQVQERQKVTYIAGEHLLTWLQDRPTKLVEQDRAVLGRLH